VIYTELLVPGPDFAARDAMLDVFETHRSALPWACAALAARAFGVYRKRGDVRNLPLPDFYVGAHAAVSNLTVLTRDRAPYRSHFPRFSSLAKPPARRACLTGGSAMCRRPRNRSSSWHQLPGNSSEMARCIKARACKLTGLLVVMKQSPRWPMIYFDLLWKLRQLRRLAIV